MLVIAVYKYYGFVLYSRTGILVKVDNCMSRDKSGGKPNWVSWYLFILCSWTRWRDDIVAVLFTVRSAFSIVHLWLHFTSLSFTSFLLYRDLACLVVCGRLGRRGQFVWRLHDGIDTKTKSATQTKSYAPWTTAHRPSQAKNGHSIQKRVLLIKRSNVWLVIIGSALSVALQIADWIIGAVKWICR